MGQPVWENSDVQLPRIPHLIVFVVGILLQYLGIVDVANTVLGREVGKNP